jgi:hypothetical protein
MLRSNLVRLGKLRTTQVQVTLTDILWSLAECKDCAAREKTRRSLFSNTAWVRFNVIGCYLRMLYRILRFLVLMSSVIGLCLHYYIEPRMYPVRISDELKINQTVCCLCVCLRINYDTLYHFYETWYEGHTIMRYSGILVLSVSHSFQRFQVWRPS